MTLRPARPAASTSSGSRAMLRRAALFAGSAAQPRARRATDAILLLGSLTGVALLGASAVPQPGFERSLVSFLRRIPSGFLGLWRALIAVLVLVSVVVCIGAIVGRRWPLLRDLVLAAVFALSLAVVASRVVTGSWPAVGDSLRWVATDEYVPPLGLTLSTSVVMAALPELRRPMRRVGGWSIVLALGGTMLALTASPIAATTATAAALAGAAAVHLIFGSSMGRPSLDDVAGALAGLGMSAHALGPAQRQLAGVFTLEAADAAGEPLLVKVYGRDAHDTQLVTTVWRKIWYREAGAPPSTGRLQQAEHEALLTVLAGQGGIWTDRVLIAGAAAGHDVVLVLQRAGQPLGEAAEPWTERVAGQAWGTLRRLHESGIAHGQVDGLHLIRDGDRVGLTDFRGATVAPRVEQLRSDQAQLLVASALGIGVERAVDVARHAVDAEELAAALPFVQPPALTAYQRRAVRGSGLDLDELRSRTAAAAAVPTPALQQMRRVTVGSVAQTVLFLLAFVALAAGIGGLDLQLLGEHLKEATWWLVVVGLLIAQAPRFTNALSVLGASPIPLPLGPVYALQLATSYIALAVPAAAARIAVTVRFFQRHGLAVGTALAVGALDGLAQFIVQMLTLIGLLLLTPVTLHLSLDGSTPSDLNRLLIIILVAAGLALITLAVVGRWRRAIIGWVTNLVRGALMAARGLRSPRRLTLLFVGNLLTELLFAITLQTFVRAIGYQVGLAEILLMNICVSLLSGLLPIPGGIGVVEGGLTYGLVLAGVPEEAAFAAVLLYRLATFYLPPIWGFFALRWLKRNEHL